MKIKPLLPGRTTILTLALVLLTGFVLTAPAGDRGKQPRSRETSQVQRDTGMNSVPRPVVDETPINPDAFGNQKKNPTPRDRDIPREQQKRRNIRR